MGSAERAPGGASPRTGLFILRGSTPADIQDRARSLRAALASRPEMRMEDLAFTLAVAPPAGAETLAVVAAGSRDLGEKLDHAIAALSKPGVRRIRERSGIYWFVERLAPEGKVAFVFPGEGSQYSGMLAGLCMEFPEARACFDRIDRVFSDHDRGWLPSQFIFPREARSEDRLFRMDGAVEAVFTANAAIHAVLTRLGIAPGMIVGHSTGDYSALMASGCVPVSDEESLLELMLDLNGLYQRLEERGEIPEARLVAVGSVEPGAAREMVESAGGALAVAMDNCPHQFVLAGSEASLQPVLDLLRAEGALLEDLPFRRAYHTPLFEPICGQLSAFYDRLPVRSPGVPVYSAATARPLPAEPGEIRRVSVEQWAQPVRFTETIEAMYEAGARIFVETGPRGNLTAFVTDILRGRPHLAVPADVKQRTGIDQLLHMLGLLAAHGVPMDLRALHARRSSREISLEKGEAPAKIARTMTLATGWPEMRLTPRTAEALRNRLAPVASPLAHSSEEATGIPAGSVQLTAQPGSIQPPSTPGLREQLLASHVRTMEAFLSTHEEIVRAALSGSEVGARVTDHPVLPARRVEVTDHPAPIVAPAEIPARMEAHAVPGSAPGVPAAPARSAALQEAPPSVPTAVNSAGEVTIGNATTELGANPTVIRDALLALVSDRTGYPPEMIGLDLDLEADLGIDSIKRVEILGSFQKETGLVEAGDMDRLSSRKTLRQILDFVSEKRGATGVPGAAPASLDAAPAAAPAPGISTVRPAAAEAEGSRELAFIREVIVRKPGEEIAANVVLRIGDALFLRDHCLGREVSLADRSLTGLPIVPLTMTMEILAEAACALLPGRVVTGMREVRGHRWLSLTEDEIRLLATARRSPGSPQDDGAVEVEVRLHAAASGAEGGGAGALLAEAVILLAASAAAPPPAGAFPLRSARASRWENDRLYKDGMFHGPAFQGVVSMDRWGEDGAEATLQVPEKRSHFADRREPAYVTDPVLLDLPGQVVGFWTAEHLDRGYVVFPFRLERLDLYGPRPVEGERFACRAKIALAGEGQVRSDLDVVAGDGTLRARLGGWWDRRFDLPRSFARLLLAPLEAELGEPWPLETGGVFNLEDYRGCQIDSAAFPDSFFTAHDGFWAEVLARAVLGLRERQQWKDLTLPAPRRLEWLFGRVAAKGAARRLLEERHGISVRPADVEIVKDEAGRPGLDGAWSASIPRPLFLSISHSGGVAVAVAGAAGGIPGGAEGHGIGVDMERLGRTRDEFADAAFTAEEQGLFSGFAEAERAEWALRCWCAKEAVAKALGRGFMGNPRNLIARRLDVNTGSVVVAMSPTMAEAHPSLGGGAIAAMTWREKDRIYGASTCQRSSE